MKTLPPMEEWETIATFTPDTTEDEKEEFMKELMQFGDWLAKNIDCREKVEKEIDIMEDDLPGFCGNLRTLNELKIKFAKEELKSTYHRKDYETHRKMERDRLIENIGYWQNRLKDLDRLERSLVYDDKMKIKFSINKTFFSPKFILTDELLEDISHRIIGMNIHFGVGGRVVGKIIGCEKTEDGIYQVIGEITDDSVEEEFRKDNQRLFQHLSFGD